MRIRVMPPVTESREVTLKAEAYNTHRRLFEGNTPAGVTKYNVSVPLAIHQGSALVPPECVREYLLQLAAVAQDIADRIED